MFAHARTYMQEEDYAVINIIQYLPHSHTPRDTDGTTGVYTLGAVFGLNLSTFA